MYKILFVNDKNFLIPSPPRHAEELSNKREETFFPTYIYIVYFLSATLNMLPVFRVLFAFDDRKKFFLIQRVPVESFFSGC